MVDPVLPRKVWPIALIVACLVAESSVLRVGIDDLDEGYFVQQAARVFHGQVPYRDFETLYSPGLVYAHAALFALLGGPSLIAPRALALAARAVVGLALFELARPLVRQPLWAAAPAVFLLVGLDDAPVRWEPHPGWPSLAFALLTIWSLSHLPRASAENLPRETSPGHSLLEEVRPTAICAETRLVGRTSARRWLVASGAFAALAFAFKQNTGVLVLGAVLLWTLRCRWWVPLAAFGVVTLLWLVPFGIAVGNPGNLRVLVGDVNQSGLFAVPDVTNLVPLACIAAGFWLLRRDSDPRLRWYLMGGAAVYLTEFPRMDTPHLVWSAPALLVLGAVALDRMRLRVGLPCVGAALLLLAPNWTGRLTYPLQALQPVDGVLAPGVTATDLSGVVAEIQERTVPGEPIFVYPTSPLVYVLSDRPNATRWDHLNPGAGNAAQIDGVIHDLSTVKLVVISDFWQSAWGPPGANASLESWLSANFHDVARHGTYRVLAAEL
jgi:4-amino-4-deoxy-L-arabinose transferase-like glycosyltransferase